MKTWSSTNLRCFSVSSIRISLNSSTGSSQGYAISRQLAYLQLAPLTRRSSIGQVLHCDRARHGWRIIRSHLPTREVYRERCFANDQASPWSCGLPAWEKCRSQRYSFSFPPLLLYSSRKAHLLLQISSPRISYIKPKTRIPILY